MILLVDVGNSNICFASANENGLSNHFRIKSFLDKSDDEYYLLINQFLKDEITDVIISSVVPIITSALTNMFKKHYNITPKVIGNKLKTGIKIIADDPKTVGADLICDIAGATDIYDEALIIDLGTASKFIYYKNKTMLGVSIAPGVAISMKTLVSSTALLPNFELVAPNKVLNGSTIPCMQSGVIFGFASLVDGMIKKIKTELNNPSLKVIGTGGLMSFISSHCEEKIDIIEPNLVLKGIYNIYIKNK